MSFVNFYNCINVNNGIKGKKIKNAKTLQIDKNLQ